MINSLLIKPAGPDCNMDCKYCFYKCKSEMFADSSHRMSNETVVNTVEKLFSQGSGNYSIVFQGGEPTLCGVNFFRRFIKYADKVKNRDQNVRFFMQTNGLLLDDEFCEFLKENGFLVGLSVDGTEDVNDFFRVDLAQKGTMTRVLHTIKLLKRHGVDFNTLSVITKKNVSRGKEIYDFLCKTGSGYMQFIPCLEYDTNENVRDFCMTPHEYGDFLCDTFDLWWNGGMPEKYVRFFDETLLSYVTYKSPNCSQQPNCAVAPVVEHDGSMYPCDFYVREDMCLGNINDTDFLCIEASDTYRTFRTAKWNEVDAECRKCKWRGLCFGDCRKNRIGGNGKSYFCESYKKFFEYSQERYLELKERLLTDRYDLRALEKGLSRNDSCPCGSGDKYKNCCMKIKRSG